MDCMPGMIHMIVLAPSKKNRSAVRAIITHQPFCALSCCIVCCSHSFPMQAACAACFSLSPSVFLFQSISLYLLKRSVSYLQRLGKGQRTTHSPASADQAPVLDSRGHMGVVSNGAEVVPLAHTKIRFCISTGSSTRALCCLVASAAVDRVIADVYSESHYISYLNACQLMWHTSTNLRIERAFRRGYSLKHLVKPAE
jgi:hypothetical protein